MSILVIMTSRGVVIPSFICILFLGVLPLAETQMGFGMRWSRQPDLVVVPRFDRDGDGRLYPQVGVRWKVPAGRGGDPAFSSILMHDDGRHRDGAAADGEFSGQLPKFPAGTRIRYYLETRSMESLGTTAFAPESTEWGARTIRIGLAPAKASPVVISELLALNSRSVADPQGGFDDWVELYNRSDGPYHETGSFQAG